MLLFSAVAALLLGGVGIVFAFLTHSRMVLLDGVFNLSYFVAGLAAIRIARLTQQPDNPRFPFGHAYFESLVNAGKGLLILGISLIALADSALTVYAGGQEIAAGPAIVYAVIATLVYALAAFAVGRRARRVETPLVRADADNWRLNTAISVAVLIGFCMHPLFHMAGWAPAAPYIDPVLVSAVIIVFLGIPVRIARESVFELLNRSPGADLERPVTEAIDTALARLPVRERYIRMVRPGRTLYVLVHAVLYEDYPVEGLRALDELRAEIDAAARRVHPRVMVDTLFTADARWAAPSAGLESPARTPGSD